MSGPFPAAADRPKVGRPKGDKMHIRELQLFWDRFFTSEKYRKNLIARILGGRAPNMEVLLHYMTYGKPKETLALSGEGDGIFVLQIGGTTVKAQALENGQVRALPAAPAAMLGPPEIEPPDVDG